MDYILPSDVERTVGATHKLFLEDPYMAQAQATVLHVSGRFILLDRTLFYAESGGQQSDRGLINGVAVREVAKKGGRRLVVNKEGIDVPAVTVDTVFVHELEDEAPFKEGDRVELVLDWACRYQTMRYHSAAHFLYHAAHQVYDTPTDVLYTKGCSITDASARLDFFGSLASGAVPDVERLANDLIKQGQPITMEPEPLTRDIQYWRSGSIMIPCGGTHVKSAAELSPIVVKRNKKGATTTRLAACFVED